MIKLDKISLLSGIIYQTPISIVNEGLRGVRNICFESAIEKTTWQRYSFETKTPLMDEDLHGISSPYYYPIFFRPGNEKVLILSVSKKVVTFLEENYLRGGDKIKFNNVAINTNELVKRIVLNPDDKFCLTYGNAYYAPHGNSLRYLTFYGDDLGEANIFRENLENMVFNRCGIRSLNKEHEIVKIGNDGSLQFNYNINDINKLTEIDLILKYLNDKSLFQIIKR